MWAALNIVTLFLAHGYGSPVQAAASTRDTTTFCASFIRPLKEYDCELYAVSTKDGFNLGLHKIKPKVNGGKTQRGEGAILFLHSAVLSGGMWFQSPSPLSLALARLGFDVYIAHFRTTRYSLGHASFTPSQQEYWDWCNDELSNYDFPAFSELVYELNDNKTFHIVGYSQGASAAIGAISYQRITAHRLKSVVLLAPILYMRRVSSPALKFLGASNFGLTGYNAGLRKFSLSIFAKSGFISKLALSTVTGPSCCADNHRLLKIATSPFSYTTYKCIAHLAQCIRLGNYQALDHQNETANIRVYGRVNPPTYIFENVPTNIPILVVHGGKDYLSSPKDIKHFTNLLSGAVTTYYVHRYAHLDIVFSKKVGKDINEKVIQFLVGHKG